MNQKFGVKHLIFALSIGLLGQQAICQDVAHPCLSYEIGLVKPDREIFDFVSQAMGREPSSILFLDDNLINVEGAREAGWDAERVTGVKESRAILKGRGLLV